MLELEQITDLFDRQLIFGNAFVIGHQGQLLAIPFAVFHLLKTKFEEN